MTRILILDSLAICYTHLSAGDRARRTYDRLLQADPKGIAFPEFAIFEWRGVSDLNDKRYAEARRDFEKSLVSLRRMEPSSPEAGAQKKKLLESIRRKIKDIPRTEKK
jgi:tetratricopeptide (TPR) repeat protein